ncbi:MAG: 16S rRNA (cytidine(1402)-2'-O)-methyltransferase, partial [Acidobacteriota bacterium]
MSGVLYVVATPLGNLDDLSPRAQRTLREVDLIACEDTRHTRQLLTHFEIGTPTTSYHEHNETAKTGQLMSKLQEGGQIALVSDAGTPLISDPGYRLVSACREEKITVIPIPGPSAAIAALSVSGLPADRCLFVGFLPRRTALQKGQLRNLAHEESTLLIYLSPHGLVPTLKRIVESLGNRRAFLAREMTKLHETHYFGHLGEILDSVGQKTPRGEYTLVVQGAPRKGSTVSSNIDVVAYVRGLMTSREISQKDAVKVAARELGLPKREVYGMMLETEDRR